MRWHWRARARIYWRFGEISIDIMIIMIIVMMMMMMITNNITPKRDIRYNLKRNSVFVVSFWFLDIPINSFWLPSFSFFIRFERTFASNSLSLSTDGGSLFTLLLTGGWALPSPSAVVQTNPNWSSHVFEHQPGFDISKQIIQNTTTTTYTNLSPVLDDDQIFEFLMSLFVAVNVALLRFVATYGFFLEDFWQK